MTDYKYRAFISYRNVARDRKWAKWLAHSLETYRAPKEAGLPPCIGKIYRDDDEGAASSDLRGLLTVALEESEFLIVICSSDTAGSRWVPEEIRYFQSLGRSDRILALLVEGDPKDSFPKQLLARSPHEDGGETSEIEPLAADVRPRRGERPSVTRNRGFLRIAAALLKCNFDDLERREQRRQRHRLYVRFSVAAGAVLTALTLYAGVLFDQTRNLNLERATFLSHIAKRESDAVLSPMDDDPGEYARAIRFGMMATRPGILHPTSEPARDELARALQAMPDVVQYNDPQHTILTMTVSPAKTRAVLVDLDGFITTIDPVRQRVIGRFKIDAPKVFRAVHHPVKNRIALECGDMIVRIVDLDEQREVLKTARAPEFIFGLDFTDDGRYLLAHGSRFLRVWDADSGTQVDQLDFSEGSMEAAWMPLRHVLSLRLADGTLILRDAVGRKSLIGFGGPDQYIEHFIPNQAGSRAFAYQRFKDPKEQPSTVYRLGYLDLEEPKAHEGNPFYRPLVGSMHLGTDDRRLIVAYDRTLDGEAQRVDVTDVIGANDRARQLAPLGSNVKHIEFMDDPDRLLTAHAKGVARVWDIRDQDTPVIAKLQGHGGAPIYDAQYSPPADQVLTQGGDGNVLGWSLRSYDGVAGSIRVEPSPEHLEFSADGKRLLVASDDYAVLVELAHGDDQRWRGKQIGAVSRRGSVKTIAAHLTTDATAGLVYSSDGSVQRFGEAGVTTLAQLAGIQHVAYSRTSDIAAIVADDDIHIKERGPEERIRKIASRTGQASSLSISSDGRLLAVGEADKRLLVMAVADGAIRYSARSLQDKVKDAIITSQFSPDGRYLAYSRQYSGFHVVDLESKREIKVAFKLGDRRMPEALATALESVSHIAFTPAGDRLFVTVQTSGLGFPAEAIASYDLQTNAVTKVMQFNSMFDSLEVIGAGERLLVAPSGGHTAAFLLSPVTKKVIARQVTPLSSALAYDPIDRKIAVGGHRTVEIWDASSATQLDAAMLRTTACTRLPMALLQIDALDVERSPMLEQHLGKNVCDFGGLSDATVRGTTLKPTGSPTDLVASLEMATPRVTTVEALREFLVHFSFTDLEKITGNQTDRAQLLAAAGYAGGIGTAKDLARARSIYETLAPRMPVAKQNLAGLLLDEDQKSARALALMTEAADAGLWLSNLLVGQRLRQQGDLPGARTRFQRAWDEGESQAAFLLAELADSERTDDTTPNEAACKWALEGSKRGDARSMIKVVSCLEANASLTSLDRKYQIKQILEEVARQDRWPQLRLYAAQRLALEH